MYTANKKLGIGKVIAKDEKFLTVYYEEIDQEKKTLLAYSPKVYETMEEAQAILDEKEVASEIGREEKEKENEKVVREALAVTYKIEEMNKNASYRQRPSSMK